MAKINVSLPQDRKDEWIKLAEEQNISMTAFLRNAVDYYKRKIDKEKDNNLSDSTKADNFIDEKIEMLLQEIRNISKQVKSLSKNQEVEGIPNKAEIKKSIKLLLEVGDVKFSRMAKILRFYSEEEEIDLGFILEEMRGKNTIDFDDDLWRLVKSGDNTNSKK